MATKECGTIFMFMATCATANNGLSSVKWRSGCCSVNTGQFIFLVVVVIRSVQANNEICSQMFGSNPKSNSKSEEEHVRGLPCNDRTQ
jgi:hypothetical protein